MRPAIGLIAAAFLASLVPVHAQEKNEPAPRGVYRVEFDVREAAGGVTEARRHYAMIIDESRKGSFQAGNRIPASSASPDGPYIDVGARIECTVLQSDGKVEVQGSFELSKVDGTFQSGALSEPIIGQVKLQFHGSVALGTPTVIATAAKYEVQATVTRL